MGTLMTATPPASLAMRSDSFSVSYTLSVSASCCLICDRAVREGQPTSLQDYTKGVKHRTCQVVHAVPSPPLQQPPAEIDMDVDHALLAGVCNDGGVCHAFTC